MGITLKHTFIPMGSIEEIKMYPLDFEEFLYAIGIGKDVIRYLRDCFYQKREIYENVHSLMLHHLREYLITGGLPDAVNSFIEKNVQKIRNIQSETYTYYKDDASKYDVVHSLKIRNIYDYLPSYMENKVKRIKFSKIEHNKNSNLIAYQDEFDYLIESGIAIPTKAISNLIFPLTESSSKNLIKLYYNDVGILTNILYKNNIRIILDLESGQILGSVYETFAAMELKAHGHELYYYDNKKNGKVDFIVNDYNSSSVIAIEIKSGKNQNNFRAITKLVKQPFNLKMGYVFGNKNIIKTQNNITTMPIYLLMFF